MPTSREIKLSSDNTSLDQIETNKKSSGIKNNDFMRHLCERAADQTRQKQIVLSDRATPENPGLYGGMWRSDGASSSRGSSIERDYDRGKEHLVRGEYTKAKESFERILSAFDRIPDAMTGFRAAMDDLLHSELTMFHSELTVDDLLRSG